MFIDLPLKIGDCVFPYSLIDFNLGDLYIILGVNWLGFYKAKLNCEAQKVGSVEKPFGKVDFVSTFWEA